MFLKSQPCHSGATGKPGSMLQMHQLKIRLCYTFLWVLGIFVTSHSGAPAASSQPSFTQQQKHEEVLVNTSRFSDGVYLSFTFYCVCFGQRH